MIKVFDEVTGTGIKIEVIGRPYSYQVRVGKTGSWTVARGRTAGQVKSGEKWGHPMYYSTLKQCLEGALDAISADEGLPKESIQFAGTDNWNRLIELEEARIRLIERVEQEYQKLIDTHGKDLAGLSKLLGKGEVAAEPEEEEEEEEEIPEETPEDPLSFPKMEARMREKGMM